MNRIPNMHFTQSTRFFDLEHETIQNMVADYQDHTMTDQEKAVQLYTSVRDGWRYDPYSISLRDESYRASVIAQKTFGNCVEKSILLVTFLRAVGIPARLHLGKVKNHLAVERLTEKFGSNELTPHGMVNVHLNGKWLKCSPAFNASLCERFKVDPLDFDGEHDSFLQQFNADGSAFMEYTDDYGFFEDVPLDFMMRNIKEHYPHIFDTGNGITEFKL